MTSQPRPRGRPRKPPRPCEIEDCANTGKRYIDNIFVCDTHKKQHDRKRPGLCSIRGCDGVVQLGKKCARRYCRSHEDHYLLEAPRRVEGALAEIAGEGRNLIDNIGDINCWMVDGDVDRPTIECDGLRWVMVRFLWTVFYGPHKGGLELHHVCGNAWCVNPAHCVPTTATMNKAIEDNLETYGGKKFLHHFAAITEEFDAWCRVNGLDHGMIERIDNGSRRFVRKPMLY